MRCQWEALMALLPEWMRPEVDRLGREKMQQLRLRAGFAPEVELGGRSEWLRREVSQADLAFCVNAASRYSPWSASSAAQGYLTAIGGHRIGICGEAIVKDGIVCGVRGISSLCVRVARDFPGLASRLALVEGSVLIIGSPASGKTTLLRDLIRQCAQRGKGSVAVVDERGELFPTVNGAPCFDTGRSTDILCGSPKPQGIEAMLRCMSPRWIAVDEITARADCEALLEACWCGVNVFATAHAASRADLLARPIYRPLVKSGVFQTLIVMARDQSWRVERMGL